MLMCNVKGHQQSALYRQVDNPRQYLIISQLGDRLAFDAFTRSEAFRKVTDWGKKGVLAKRPNHRGIRGI